MKEAQKTLCRYCVKLFPLEDREHSTRPFHPNVTAFLQQISSYSLCIFIRSQLELDDIAKSNSSTDAQPALLQVRLKELHCTPHGVRWAFLEVLVQSHTRKVYTFSITTCEKSCMLPSAHISIITNYNQLLKRRTTTTQHGYPRLSRWKGRHQLSTHGYSSANPDTALSASLPRVDCQSD